MLSTIHSDVGNQVSSHNDLLPSSIYIDKNRISFVDWEYSAENHRSYDLAWLSMKASLTPHQEQKLVTAYDKTDHLNIQYSVAVMKPIINYLLLLWHLSSKAANAITSNLLLRSLAMNIQEAISKQSAKKMVSELRFCLFHHDDHGGEGESSAQSHSSLPHQSMHIKSNHLFKNPS
jgi:hypothetical protein